MLLLLYQHRLLLLHLLRHLLLHLHLLLPQLLPQPLLILQIGIA